MDIQDNGKTTVITTNYVSDYDDFAVCLDTLEKGAKGYVYDKDSQTIYEVVCTVTSDAIEDYDNADDALSAEDDSAEFDYTTEFIAGIDVDVFVGVKIVDTYKEDVDADDIDFDCEFYC